MRLRRVIFLWIPLALLVLTVAAAGLIGWATLTPEGSRWALTQGLRQAPVPVSVGRIEGSFWSGLTLYQVRAADADWSLEARRMAWGWTLGELRERRLHLTRLEGEGIRFESAPSAEADPDAPPPEIPERIELPLDIQLDRLLLTDLKVIQGEALVEIERIAGAFSVSDGRTRIHELTVQAPTGQVALSGEAELTRPFPFEADVHWSGRLPELGDAQGEAKIHGDLNAIELEHRLASPEILITRGRVELAPLRLDLQGEAPLLRWPLTEAEPALARAEEIRYRLQGPLDALAIELDTRLDGDDFPQADLHFVAELHPADLAIETLELKTLKGRLVAVGQLGWADGLDWQVRLEGAGIRPETEWPEWPGNLGLQARVEGTLGEQGLDLSADLERLDGELRGYPLSVSGGADYQADQLRLRKLLLVSGDNRIEADGPAFPQMDLALELNTPNLSAFLPDLAGAAEGHLRLQGTAEAPRVNGELSANRIAYADYALASAQIKLHWPGGDTPETGNHIQLQQLDLAGQQWDRLDLWLLGDPESHRLKLETEGGPADLRLAASGALIQQRWQGELSELDLLAGQWGDWRAAEPVTLELSAEQASWSVLCLSSGKNAGRVCTQGAWTQADGVDASLELARVDLKLLAPVLPEETVIDGRVDGRIDVRGQGETLHAEGRIVPGDGYVRLPEMENLPRRFAYGNAAVEFTYDGGALEAKAGIDLPQEGQAKAELRLTPLKTAGMGLGGRIQLSFPNLDLIRGFVPQVRFNQGSLALDAALGGTLEQPEVEGELALKNGDLQMDRLGLHIRELEFTARNRGEEALVLEAVARSGDGTLQLDGTIELNGEQHFPLDLRIRGERFQVIQTTEAQAVASPEIAIQGNLEQIRISGKLAIPEATVEIKDLPTGSVAVSEDEVIVGQEEPPPPKPGPLRGELEIALGDAVSFSGFGLTTRLTGSMGVLFTAGGTKTQGAVLLKDGQYKAYGQNLTIEQGRFLFTGPPDNPNLDIRAMRLSEDGTVKAYLRVFGTAQSPKTDVYTEPGMSKVEALSYLLTGNGTDHESDINLFEAAASLGLDKTQPALSAIAENTGLDKLQVNTGSSLDQAALEGGKYLNPNLYMSYSQNLFTNQGALSLKYRLSDHLSVETKSGESQSVDLIYSIERD